MKARKRHIPVGLRRGLAAVAVTAVALAGWHITDRPTGIGAINLVPGATADPTGPPGPTGGMTDGGGSQFQPPQMPSSMPDYQGGNQPPLNQDNGISIYNSGAPQVGQQAGQQAGQQPQQGGQQPQHGTQPPDYQTATPYTQGPGKANPDYQAPQQNSPQQGSQQQPQQGQQQQPNQQQPQNQQDQDTQQLQQRCQNGALILGAITPVGGGGRVLGGHFAPRRDPTIIPPWPAPPPGSEGLQQLINRMLECNCIDDASQAVGKTIKDFDQQIRKFLSDNMKTQCTALYITCVSVLDQKATKWLDTWGLIPAGVFSIASGLFCSAVGSAVPVVGTITLGSLCTAGAAAYALEFTTATKLAAMGGKCLALMTKVADMIVTGSPSSLPSFIPLGGGLCT
ncbi:hypothetical protein [Mycobacteroides chelonae]|uniref:hypothetical protein n=1 Tax=Mycobacteroides chelonae TaxID=1774 RepID=UPI003B285C6E